MLVAGVVALLFGLRAGSHWEQWLLFWYGEPFGKADPILGKDLGFYVFQLPWLEALQAWLVGLVLLSAIASVAVYVVAGVVGLDVMRGLRVGPTARRHLSVLASAMLLVLAFGAWLDAPGLLLKDSSLIHGATNADVAIAIPALRVLLAAALVGAALALAQISVTGWWPLLTAAALYVGVSVAGSVGATAMQRFVIAPNEYVRETPYIEHNIAATRSAFAIDTVEERELSGDALLTRADIDANAATLGNVRLWDHQPLLQTFAQIQEIRTYYDFVSVHNDRYRINGEYRQIMLSARELNSESLPNRNWINERLTFTHGYGVTLGPVNQVTPEGLPVLFIKDLPPQSSVDLHRHRAEHLLRPAVERPRVREDEGARVPLSEGRRQRLRDLRGARRRVDVRAGPTAAVQPAVPLVQGAAERRHHRREPRALPSPAVGAHRAHRAVSRVRQRSVPRDLRRPADLGAGRVHGEPPLPVLDAGRRRHQLHPQLGEGDGGRLPRDGHVLSDRHGRSGGADAAAHVPGALPSARGDAGRHADAAAVSRRHLRAAGGDVRDVSHDEPGGLLQQGRPVGGARRSTASRSRA